MKRVLQIVAVVVALSAVALWAARGANRGWTKTQVQVKTVDEVTGLEAVSYQDHFIPGIDFLGGALIGTGVWASATLLIRNKPKNQN